jgi:hypothetical protein
MNKNPIEFEDDKITDFISSYAATITYIQHVKSSKVGNRLCASKNAAVTSFRGQVTFPGRHGI